jgi:putative ABC transport system permease protein
MFELEKAIREWKRGLRKLESFEDGAIVELESHLRDEIDRQKGEGLSGEAAFAKAVDLVGRPESIGGEYSKSQAPETSWAHSRFPLALIGSFFKIAWRKIIRQKGYSLINVAGLALGFACCLIILFWVRQEMNFDRFHDRADRLYRVFFSVEKMNFQGTALMAPLAGYLQQTYPEIAAATVFASRSGSKISFGPEKGTTADGSFVDPAFFKMFTFPFLQGAPETAFSNPSSIVITEDLARKLFGDADPIGKTLKLNDGNRDLSVSGVLRRIPRNSTLRFDYLLSSEIAPAWIKSWDVKTTPIFVRLQETADPADISRKIAGVLDVRHPDWHNTLKLQPLTDTHLHELGGGGRILYVYIFSALAFVVLVIAVVNFMNLSTARAEKRAKEIGIKKVLGSSRLQLIGQFLTESTILAFIALVLAVGLVKLALPSLNALGIGPLEMRPSGLLIAAVLGFTLLTGILAGSYPAFLLSSFEPVAAFKGRSGRSRGARLRKILVIGQLALSTIFIVSVFALDGQMRFIRNRDLGFNKANVVVLELPGALGNKGLVLKEALSGNPDVVSATLASDSLEEWGSSSSPDWPGKQPDQIFDMGIAWVDEDYQRTLGLKMAEGRFFSRDFPGDLAKGWVINEAAVKAMGMTSSLGQKLSMPLGEKIEGTVIGVVKDFHTESLQAPVRPFALLYSRGAGQMLIRIRPGNTARILSSIEAQVRKIVPNDPFLYRFLDQSLDRLYQTDRVTGKLIVYAAGLALLISCLGLFGLVSYLAEQRTKEIGVRKVMGASTAWVVMFFMKDILRSVLVAGLISAPLSYWIGEKWLRRYAFRISVEPWVFLTAVGLVAVIALLTVSAQSFKAALARPAESLRCE